MVALTPIGTRGLRIRRASLVFRLPAVPHLLVGMLQRSEGGAMRAFALAVLLDGAVMRLDLGALGLAR